MTRFKNNENGTITDLKTKLIWPDKSAKTDISRIDAESLVDDLEIAGIKQWRLPQKEELEEFLNSCLIKNDDFERSKKAEWFRNIGFTDLINWDTYFHTASYTPDGLCYVLDIYGGEIEEGINFIGTLFPVSDIDV
jgi:hypothetical protein